MDITTAQTPLDQSTYLSILSQVPASHIKPFVDSLLPELGTVTVQSNRTGLVMLPYTESVQHTRFHLGEVLVSEAQVLLHGQTGYGACLGRDLEQSLAIAILDAALQADTLPAALAETIQQFIHTEAQAQAEAEETLLRQVEATRVEMETF